MALPMQYTTGLPWLTRCLLAPFMLAMGLSAARGQSPVRFSEDIQPVLKARCVACHGPAKSEGKLDLSTPKGILKGGKQGPAIRPHDADESLLWQRIEDDEMPPKHPLPEAEKARIKEWIAGGAGGLERSAANDEVHWSFRPLRRPALPVVARAELIENPIDRFVESTLEHESSQLAGMADRQRILRRVALGVTGLPPTTAERAAFLSDRSPEAYERMVDHYLSRPGYGERWGRFWLDGAGYADSNGYFNADSDRPLAYRYRDYVIRSLNVDKPFDRFLAEQLAGDELAGFKTGGSATPEQIELLTATHFLRNGQDGSGESDGNPDERRVDRYTALETCQQIIGSSILGLTIQCAKCHAHKFEPITHEDYYRFQAILYPAFPANHPDLWVKPQERIIHAPTSEEKSYVERESKSLDEELVKLRDEAKRWVANHRPRGEVIFRDNFDGPGALTDRWSNTAPGDGAPGGKPPVTIDGPKGPSVRIRDGRLEILSAETLDSWIVTKQSFDWSPDVEGEAIQVTFDLVANSLGGSQPAERMGYFLAARDFDDSTAETGGNILVDGHPDGPSSVVADYPGKDQRPIRSIGSTGYRPGRNYGVRVTNIGKSKFRLEHMVDGVPESNSIEVTSNDLPIGSFGFEFHRDRSFVVDHIVVERIPTRLIPEFAEFSRQRGERGKSLEALESRRKELEKNPPGRIAWVTDRSASPPETKLLLRGDYGKPGATQPPAPLSALGSKDRVFGGKSGAASVSTGRRLEFARWLTDPRERASGLVARVQVNRIWQSYFGEGIVSTSENLGMSGATPTHPELLDWLAYEFVRSGWSFKHVHRLILQSRTFRQASDSAIAGPRYAGFPSRRLEAEAIRDAMLAVSGELDPSFGGPYVPVQVADDGAVGIAEAAPGAKRRSVYLQSRRSQVISLLQVFDSPSIVFNSIRRGRTAMPLQSLTLLNSEFARARSSAFAGRILRRHRSAEDRIEAVYLAAFGRSPTPSERRNSSAFLDSQLQAYSGKAEAELRAWSDFCQAILISNEFLYLD